MANDTPPTGAPTPPAYTGQGAPTAPAAENQGNGISMAEWSGIRDRMDGIAQTYNETMTWAIERDWDEINTEEQRLRDQMDSGSSDDSDDDLRRFKEEITRVENEAKDYWRDFKSEYGSSFQAGEPLAKEMDDRRKAWENDVIGKLGAFDEQLRGSQIAQHWKGGAGESYRKQLNPQTRAMSDMRVSASNAQVSMISSSNIQQVIYNSVYNSVHQVNLLIRTMATSTTDNMWAERIYTMRDNNQAMLEWLRTFKDEYSSSWGSMQSDMIGQLGEARESNAELTQSLWPAATSQSSGYVPDYGGGQQQQPPASQPGPAASGDQSGRQGEEGQGANPGDDDYE